MNWRRNYNFSSNKAFYTEKNLNDYEPGLKLSGSNNKGKTRQHLRKNICREEKLLKNDMQNKPEDSKKAVKIERKG